MDIIIEYICCIKINIRIKKRIYYLKSQIVLLAAMHRFRIITSILLIV